MKRKTLFTVFAVMLAVVTIASASAFDLGGLAGDSNAKTVTIDGFDFNIPDGFSEDASHAITDEKANAGSVEYTMNGKLYEKGNVIMVILISDYGDYDVTDDIVKSLGGEEKTFANQTGYLTQDGDYYVFSYAKDNKLVAMSSTEDDIFDQFIIAEE